MEAALDSKGRNVLTEAQITTMAMLYSSLQGHLQDRDAMGEDLKSIHVFLDVVSMCGMAILSQVSVDEMWGALAKTRERL